VSYTTGALLLVELGVDPATVIEQLHAIRPGAIETSDIVRIRKAMR